jgi:hypothetical protein
MRRGQLCLAAIALTAAWWAPRAMACKRDMVEAPTKVSPTADESLPMNGRIVLDRAGGLLGGEFGDSLLQIEERHPELRSDRERVALRVVEKYDRRDGATVVLTAAHHLQPSTAYTLVLGSSMDDPALATWTTASSEDRSPPRWFARPTADAPVDRYIECRVDTHVAVNVPTVDAPWIRTEWRRHGERRWRASLNAPKDGQIRVWLPPYERYTLKLTAIDFAGNEVRAPGPPLEVVMPSRDMATRK